MVTILTKTSWCALLLLQSLCEHDFDVNIMCSWSTWSRACQCNYVTCVCATGHHLPSKVQLCDFYISRYNILLNMYIHFGPKGLYR